jgi:hypothetical protein
VECVQVGVRQVVVSGTLRLTLAPLLERLPVVAGGRMSLLGAPHFSYHTSIFGGNPFVLPGVEAWIKCGGGGGEREGGGNQRGGGPI